MRLSKIASIAALMALTSTAAFAQTAQSDPKNTGTKPGQGMTGGADTDGVTEVQKSPAVGANSGSSTGAVGSGEELPANTQPGANGKGPTPNSNSGPVPK